MGSNWKRPSAAAQFTLLFSAAAAFGLWSKLGWHPAAAWLLPINVGTYAVFGHDKRRSKLERNRVPENMLLFLALAGGTLGAACAMWTLPHKIRKPAFLFPFLAVVAVQVIGLSSYGVWEWQTSRHRAAAGPISITFSDAKGLPAHQSSVAPVQNPPNWNY